MTLLEWISAGEAAVGRELAEDEVEMAGRLHAAGARPEEFLRLLESARVRQVTDEEVPTVRYELGGEGLPRRIP